MADRVSISFKLGGTLSPEAWLELAAIIAGESLSIEWDGPAFEPSHRAVGAPLELFANEVAWGKVEPLESFCQDHGLSYRFWAGGFFAEWSAERVVFRGEGTPDSFIVDESDRVLIDRHEIVRRGSRSRDRLFGADVFADPVRDMLLDLYAAHYEQQNVSVSSLRIAAAVPATTALRSARIMVERGWAIRTRDRHDARRIHVRLSDEAREKLDLYFADTGSAIAAES